jgi:hypothetical protein
MSDDPHDRAGAEPVGSVGEEATKLLRAVQDWARDNGSDYAGATASAAAGAASSAHRIGEHLATGGEDCRYCPLCQVISAVRATPPEVREHLAAAATSLMHAAASALATPVPDRGRRGGEASPVEKIDLSDDEWEDD